MSSLSCGCDSIENKIHRRLSNLDEPDSSKDDNSQEEYQDCSSSPNSNSYKSCLNVDDTFERQMENLNLLPDYQTKDRETNKNCVTSNGCNYHKHKPEPIVNETDSLTYFIRPTSSFVLLLENNRTLCNEYCEFLEAFLYHTEESRASPPATCSAIMCNDDADMQSQYTTSSCMSKIMNDISKQFNLINNYVDESRHHLLNIIENNHSIEDTGNHAMFQKIAKSLVLSVIIVHKMLNNLDVLLSDKTYTNKNTDPAAEMPKSSSSQSYHSNYLEDLPVFGEELMHYISVVKKVSLEIRETEVLTSALMEELEESQQKRLKQTCSLMECLTLLSQTQSTSSSQDFDNLVQQLPMLLQEPGNQVQQLPMPLQEPDNQVQQLPMLLQEPGNQVQQLPLLLQEPGNQVEQLPLPLTSYSLLTSTSTQQSATNEQDMVDFGCVADHGVCELLFSEQATANLGLDNTVPEQDNLPLIAQNDVNSETVNPVGDVVDEISSHVTSSNAQIIDDQLVNDDDENSPDMLNLLMSETKLLLEYSKYSHCPTCCPYAYTPQIEELDISDIKFTSKEDATMMLKTFLMVNKGLKLLNISWTCLENSMVNIISLQIKCFVNS